MLNGKRLSKIVSIMLCLMMVLTLFPASALASQGQESSDTQTTGTEADKDTDDKDGSEQKDPSLGDESSSEDEDLTLQGDGSTLQDEDSSSQGDGSTSQGEGLTSQDEESTSQDEDAAPAPCTVYFHVGDAVTNVTVTAGTAVEKPAPDPDAPEGMEFSYWYSTDENTPYDFDTFVVEDLDLFAKFSESTTGGEDTLRGMAPSAASAAPVGGIEDTTTVYQTYHFWVNGLEVKTETLASGETLVEPTTPAADAGKRFVGWFFDDGTPFTSFGVQTFDSASEIKLTAQFALAYCAFFHNKDGAVIETRVPGADNKVSTANVSNLILGGNEKLTGWATTPDGTTDVGATVEVKSGNVDLYPIVKTVVWVYFNTNGGTYVPPLAIERGEWLTFSKIENHVRTQTGSSQPSRDGYSFVHWYIGIDNLAGLIGSIFSKQMFDSITLNAAWLSDEVNYTVVFWKQGTSGGDSYSIDSTVTRKADAGDVVSETSNDRSAFAGFTFEAAKSPSVTVAADGSTQLNLYYSRIFCSIDFKVPQANSGGNYDYGNLHSLTPTPKTGYYGTEIGYWPSPTDITIQGGYVFTGWYTEQTTGGVEVKKIDRFENSGGASFDSGTLTLYAHFEKLDNRTDVYTVYYYLETSPGNWPSNATSSTSCAYEEFWWKHPAFTYYKFSNPFNGYTLSSYSINQNSSKYSAFDGLSLGINPAWTGETVTKLKVYYTINKYDLVIKNASTQIRSYNLPYLTALSGYIQATPSRPSYIDASASWAGWFTTENGLPGSEMNWNGKMPANDLTVYGVWKEPVFSAVAHLTPYGTSGSTRSLGSITNGDKVNSSALSAAEAAARLNPPHAGDTFVGWLQFSGGTLSPFNPNAPVYGDIEIYPNWTSSVRYSVTYALNGAGGTAQADNNRYAPGAQAQVLALGSGVTPPTDKVFVGWKSDLDGKIYYPGGTVLVTGNLTLTAQWENEVPKVHITYYGNGGTVGGTTTSVDGTPVPNNTFYRLIDVGFTRTGYTFDGWYTNASGTGGTSYAVNDSVRLGLSGTVTGLYAKWKPNTFAVTLSFSPSGSATTTFTNGSFDYDTDVAMSWTPASGYQTLNVKDNGDVVTASGNSYTINDIKAAHNVVVTMVQIKHKLSFGQNDGVVYQTEDVAEYARFQFPTTVSGTIPAGQSFVGWSTAPNQNLLSAVVGVPGAYGTMQTQDRTYYAVLVPIVYHVSIAAAVDGTLVSFVGNGDYLYHENAALSWTPITGYETVSVTDNGRGVTFSGNSYTVSAVDADHNIIVTLEPADYLLTYIAYSGSTDQTTQPVEWNQPFRIAENTFSYAKHYFLGWSTDPGATTPDTTYAPKTYFAHMPANDITLYGVWAEQKPVTLTSNGDSVPYTGRNHSVSGFTSDVSGLTFKNIRAGVSASAPGEYPAKFSGKENLVIKRAGVVVTEQYDVTYKEGVLTINPIITYENSINHAPYATESVPYGTGDATYPKPDLNFRDRFGNVYYWDGTYNIAPGDPDSTDVKTNLTIRANYTLTKTLTIQAKSPTVDYTGAKQIVQEAEAFAAGLTVTGYRVYGEGTDAGQYNVRVFLDHVVITNAVGDDITYQYTVVPVNGRLTIKPIDMPMSVIDGYTGVYDNLDHFITVTPSVTDKTTIAYSYNPHNRPSDYRMMNSPAVRDVEDSKTIYFVVKNPNYNPYYGSATVTITPLPITVKAQDKSWVYDGNEHTWPYYSITSGAFLGGDGIANVTFKAVSKIKDVGSVDNLIRMVRLTNGTNPRNYSITPEKGTLTITPSGALTITATPVTVPYDGYEHSIGVRTNITAGTEFYYSLTNSTNLADYTKGEYKQINAATAKTVYIAAVNSNYNTAFGSALLIITPRMITLRSDTASKIYDGLPLTAPGVTQTGDFAHGEGFTTAPQAITSITDVGFVSNQLLRPTLLPGTLEGNYQFTMVLGRLTVNSRNVLLVADDATKNFGDPDPVFAYHTATGTYSGIDYYDVLPGDVSKMNVTVYRGDATAVDAETPGVHTSLVPTVGVGSILFSNNYGSNAVTGSLTINPQITYITGTTDTVTGMPAKQWTPYNTTATLSTGATAVRFGYKISGWLDATTNTAYALGATIPNHKNNLSLTAQWTPNLNTVSFLTGTGAAVANMPANIAAAAYLSTVTLQAALPTRLGFTFDGWQTSDVDGVARVYAAGATFAMPNNPVTLTAIWAANLSTVTYLANYPGGGSYVEGTHATLSNVTVAANRFNRAGYRFLGWSDTATGTVTRQPGGTFQMPATAITFYAQWERLEYSVSYIVTGGTVAGLDGNTPYATYNGLHYGDAMPIPDDPTQNGYTFGGWRGLPTTVPLGGVTVYGALTALQAPAAPLTERIGDNETPLAGKGGIPLWAILAGAGLLGLGLLWFLLLLAKRRKEENEGQGAK